MAMMPPISDGVVVGVERALQRAEETRLVPRVSPDDAASVTFEVVGEALANAEAEGVRPRTRRRWSLRSWLSWRSEDWTGNRFVKRSVMSARHPSTKPDTATEPLTLVALGDALRSFDTQTKARWCP